MRLKKAFKFRSIIYCLRAHYWNKIMEQNNDFTGSQVDNWLSHRWFCLESTANFHECVYTARKKENHSSWKQKYKFKNASIYSQLLSRIIMKFAHKKLITTCTNPIPHFQNKLIFISIFHKENRTQLIEVASLSWHPKWNLNKVNCSKTKTNTGSTISWKYNNTRKTCFFDTRQNNEPLTVSQLKKIKVAWPGFLTANRKNKLGIISSWNREYSNFGNKVSMLGNSLPKTNPATINNSMLF